MALSLKDRFKLSRFISGGKATNQSIKLGHQNIFILPTLRGLGFVVLILILLLIAFVYNNNLAYLLGFLLASVFFISILHSFKSLAGLVISQSHCQSTFAGEAVKFEIIIDNPTHIDRLNLQVQLESILSFYLKAQEKSHMMLYLASDKRGWLDIKTVTLSSTYPFGFFRAWSPLHFSARALVYPKPTEVELPFPEAEGGNTKSVLTQQSTKGSEDFYGLKEYQAGDPVRHIHWKAFAKGQGLFSKQYGGDNLSELWLNYDQIPGHNVEERLSQLCRWVIDAEKKGLKYGFTVAGVKLEPNHGSGHYEKCLSALALF